MLTTKEQKGVAVDNTNLEILKILQQKARIPNVEVSRMINLAPSAVLERIRKMESQGIIDGYEVRLNPERFNRSLVSFMQVYPNHGSNNETIAEALADFEEVQEVHYIAGDDCFLIKARTANMPELARVRSRIGSIEGVQATKTFPVLATRKETAQIPLHA